ncbi:hypothetical protein [Limnobacter sp.]|uniref:hypothetical protein n=1 Tax=Limnobacter sp. TaxID=2003368 RepID=UPI0025B8CF9A|nr:hypothetical protein [Limnobacter sp.]
MTAKFGLLIDAKTKGENNIKRLGNSMQGVQGKAKNLGMAVRGVGLAFKGLFAIAAVGGLVAIGRSAINTADAFGKLSTRTGIAADKLLAYVNAGKLADVSQSDLETGLRTLARTQVEASEGVKTYADAYAKLGVTVKNQDGTLKNSDQLLSDIADRFQDLPNGPEKAAVAMDIFGRSGQKMITLLNGGSEALDEFGYNLSDSFARNSEEFNDNLTKVGIELDRLKMQILDDLLPTLIDLSETFIDITKSIRDAADAFAKFFGIGDEAMIAKNTVLINALNKNIARTKRLLAEQREEAAAGGPLLGIRTGQIEQTERLLAEFERKRQKLRDEINAATDPVTVEDRPTRSRTQFRRLPEEENKKKTKDDKPEVQASDRVLELTRQVNAARLEGNRLKEVDLGYDLALQQLQEKGLTGNNLALEQNQLLTNYTLERLDVVTAMGEAQDKVNSKLTESQQLFVDITTAVKDGLGNAIMGLIDGTKSLSQSLSGILRQLGTMFLQFGVKSLLGGIFPSANGNVFAQNKIVPFAYGGVVKKPTLFPMANGTGLMGEAGPEAIMPLRRSRSGRLGVEAAGGGATTVNVSVDASGSSVQGDGAQAAQLGKAIGFAVQTEILKQKRPGGLLATV